jgi:hypothetical protein
LSAPWWPFSRRARTFALLQIEILAEAIALPGPTHLVTDESPQEYDVGGVWAHAGERTWPIPAAVETRELFERVLVAGDWCIYACPRPVDAAAIPDGFRVEASELAEFALSHAMSFLAQAFHDNDPWRVFVESVEYERRAAA